MRRAFGDESRAMIAPAFAGNRQESAPDPVLADMSGFPSRRGAAGARHRRRRSPRLPGKGAEVRLVAGAGRLVNRSIEGLAIESDRGLPVGRTVWIGERPRSRARLEAIVRWSRLHRTVRTASGEIGPLFLSGLEIVRRSAGRAARRPRETAVPPAPNGSILGRQTQTRSR